MARPTKYTPELIQKAKEYVEGGWESHQIDSVESVIPSHEGLAFYLGISRTCMYDWAKDEDKQEFSDTLDEINAKQKMVLLMKGLKNEFNSNITKLALGNHGMHDQNKTEHSGVMGFRDLTGKTDEELEAIINGSE